MSMLDKAEAALRKMRRCKLAKTGDYHYEHQGINWVISDVPMTQGSTRAEVDTGELIIRSSIIDFIVDIADLTFEERCEGPRGPKAGDLIVFGESQYQVCSIAGEKPWEPHGRDGKSLRIHTRQVKK